MCMSSNTITIVRITIQRYKLERSFYSLDKYSSRNHSLWCLFVVKCKPYIYRCYCYKLLLCRCFVNFIEHESSEKKQYGLPLSNLLQILETKRQIQRNLILSNVIRPNRIRIFRISDRIQRKRVLSQTKDVELCGKILGHVPNGGFAGFFFTSNRT